MKKAGSALIIAVSLIAAIGGISFAIAKMVYFQSSTYSAQENGIVAYYAAESGIEEAFLRYRYNQDTEIPELYVTSSSSSYPGLSEAVYRNKLSDKTIQRGTYYNDDPSGLIFGYLGIARNTLVNDQTQPLNDLRIGYVGTKTRLANLSEQIKPYFGQNITGDRYSSLLAADVKSSDYGTGEYSFLKIPKDESLKISLNRYDFESSGLNLMIKYSDVLSGDNADTCKAIAEVTLRIDYGTDADPDIKEFKEIISHNPATCATVLGTTSAKLLGGSAHEYISDQNAFFYQVVGATSMTGEMFSRAGVTPPLFSGKKKAVMSIKPLNHDAFIGLVADQCKLRDSLSGVLQSWTGTTGCNYYKYVPAGPVTRVESTGHFGGVTKNLTANIDRQSGSLYDLFDYVLYSNE